MVILPSVSSDVQFSRWHCGEKLGPDSAASSTAAVPLCSYSHFSDLDFTYKNVEVYQMKV